jgi:hypothetical protein
LELGIRLILEPEHVAVGVLQHAASPLVEVVPTHVRRHETLGNSLESDDRGAGVHQPLHAVPLRRAVEGRLDLFAGGYGDAPRVRGHQQRYGVAVGDGLKVPCDEASP